MSAGLLVWYIVLIGQVSVYEVSKLKIYTLIGCLCEKYKLHVEKDNLYVLTRMQLWD